MRTNAEQPEPKARRLFAFLRFALPAALLAGCGTSTPLRRAAEAARSRITVSGKQFLAGAGKPILLHGLNVINKSQAGG